MESEKLVLRCSRCRKHSEHKIPKDSYEDIVDAICHHCGNIDNVKKTMDSKVVDLQKYKKRKKADKLVERFNRDFFPDKD